MKKIIAVIAVFTMASTSHAQDLAVSIAGGYTVHTGEHHSAYQSSLISTTGYDNAKPFTFNTGLRAVYTLPRTGFGIGLGVDYGNFQTKKDDVDVLSSLQSVVNATSLVATTGRYCTPYLLAQYRQAFLKNFYAEAGVSAGICIAGLGKSNGILLVETPAILIIPAQKVGAVVHTGKSTEGNSAKFMGGIQAALGYRFCKNWSVAAEGQLRFSKVQAFADVLGTTQNFTYNLSLPSVRLSISRRFLCSKRDKPAPQQIVD